MTREDFLELAEEAGFFITHKGAVETANSYGVCDKELMKFAELLIHKITNE